MYPALLLTHNALRWLILVVGVLAIVKAGQGLTGRRPYAAARRLGVIFMALLHVQLLTGLVLFVISPLVRTAMTEGLKLPLMIDADDAARGTLALARAGTGQGYVPVAWRPIMLAIQHVPSVLFRRTNI